MKDKIYNLIKDAGGWVNLDDVVEYMKSEGVKVDRKEVNRLVKYMRDSPVKSKIYPGIKISSKRNNKPMTFGGQKATYDIKYKVEL